MIRFNRRIPFVSVVLFAAAVTIVVAAALTSWWVLLALIPLTMMLGCLTMMGAHGGMPCAPTAARWGCCRVSAPPAAPADPERKGANAPLIS